ncbi:hypothetical protein B566_EDAN011436, partial [Ephemera danica]
WLSWHNITVNYVKYCFHYDERSRGFSGFVSAVVFIIMLFRPCLLLLTTRRSNLFHIKSLSKFKSRPSERAMAKRTQPSWSPPDAADSPKLKLFNSLTRQKEVFVPQNGRKVLSYISFDILRRVLANYFGYDVMYVMNITDIDDKIIKRARQNHLYDKYVAENHNLEKVLDDANKVMQQFSVTVKSTDDPDKRTMFEGMLSRLVKAIEALEASVKSKDAAGIKQNQAALLQEARDPLADWLDKQFGSSITDNSIFANLPREWEAEFHKDMDAINVQPPSVLTRVSEYIPEIIDYIKKVIDNGYAYESNGSVYFDVVTFDQRPNHHYAKLVPEAYGDAKSLQEGEGDLSVSEERLQEKRAPMDFALWKSSKPGEPSWPSPWGAGRPGWHIECSVMASAICGSSLDIHTGGVDLKFPHHDNELAQAEAFYDNDHWVRYFLHSGHLTIAGCKMSKSLKNFVTIRAALAKHSARQLRFAFLLHQWKDTLDYSDNTMELAAHFDKYLNEFFLNVKDLTSAMTDTTLDTFDKWTPRELQLDGQFVDTKSAVHAALCDNVDTRTALDAIRDLVASCNVYIREKNPDSTPPNRLLLRNIAAYITDILRIFGAIPADESIGFPLAGADSTNREEMLMPYLRIMSEFRERVRQEARTLKATSVLQECDRLRDVVLPEVGVRLEDREGGAAVVKLVDKEELLRDREAKAAQEAAKLAEKEKKKAEQAAQQAQKDAQRKIPPQDMFRTETDKACQHMTQKARS